MGLSNFPSAAEGVLPMLVINTVQSVALLKSMFRSITATPDSSYLPNMEQEYDAADDEISSRERRVSITQYKSLCHNRSSMAESSRSGWTAMAECCCVCLCRFEANEEVSQLPCKHFFHRGCLDKWFDNKHTTCPLCRSME